MLFIIAAIAIISVVFSVLYAIKAYNVGLKPFKKEETDESNQSLVLGPDQEKKVARYVWTSWFLFAVFAILFGLLEGHWVIGLIIGILSMIPYVFVFRRYIEPALYVVVSILATLAVLLVSTIWGYFSSPPAIVSEETTQEAQSSQSSEDVGTDDCPQMFRQTAMPLDTKISDGWGNDVLDIKAEAKDLPLDQRGAFISQEVNILFEKELGRNVRFLVAAATTAGQSVDASQLITPDGKCLSVEGQALYYKMTGVYSSFVESYETVDAVPQGLVNSGFDSTNNRLVVATSAGIWGDDVSGVRLTGIDGKYIYILNRCGNWTFSPNGDLVNKIPPGETDNPPPPSAPGKGTANPESQHGFWGDVSGGGGETTAPTGPSTSGDGGKTWQPAKPASPSTKPGSVTPPGVQAPPTGGKPADNNDLSKPTPPTGGVTVDKDTSGTTPGGGTPTVPDSGSDNTGIQAPPD